MKQLKDKYKAIKRKISIVYTFTLTIALSSYSLGQEQKKEGAEELRQKQEDTQRIYEEKLVKYNTLLNDILIIGDSSECLVLNSETDECILSLNEFNNNLKRYVKMRWSTYLNPYDTSKATPDLDIDSVRHLIYFSKMKEAYTEAEQDKWEKRAEHQDSLAKLSQQQIEQITQEHKDTLLKPLYNEYYEELYKEQVDSTYLLLLSTDSIFLDSLLTVAKENSELILPVYSYAHLPKETQKVVDTLKKENWSPILKTALGYFTIIHNNYIVVRDEITFEEALPQLVYMQPREKFNCNVTTDEAWTYYEENEDLFLTPDTMDITIQIAPEVYVTKKEKASFDILNRESITMSNIALSINDQQTLYNKINWKQDACSVTLYLEHGECHLVATNLRKGGLLTPFKQVKADITKKLCTNIERRDKEQMFSTYEGKRRDKSKELFSEGFRKLLMPDEMELQKELTLLTDKYGDAFSKESLKQMAMNGYVNKQIKTNTLDWINNNTTMSQQLAMLIQINF